MSLISKLAEQKILAAIERGEMDNLSGQGKPLILDDTSAIPEELRAGYRLLKNAGYLPPELELRKEIRHVEELLHHVETSDEERALMRKLNFLRARLNDQGRPFSCLVEEERYKEKLLQRIIR
ncbi:MAG: DUF1992 domain-containing protein [Gammaproteobacteria bacterium]|nr:DUF1992 domain-containing protein [Gammaproteobacteria bacterium]